MSWEYAVGRKIGFESVKWLLPQQNFRSPAMKYKNAVLKSPVHANIILVLLTLILLMWRIG
jgi:hypothetical protein